MFSFYELYFVLNRILLHSFLHRNRSTFRVNSAATSRLKREQTPYPHLMLYAFERRIDVLTKQIG